ncbi:histidine kinase [Fulvivirga sp. M361]|uniref:sensor histidine kinase n=1 Tax=Fulvivirga sp. M361 TaxID=2594266 RepID=UPI00117A8909|nr:sensor histidine kinase [Fulvivirga sp. M361]TRX57555.1 histidine kinase [Fulvivirga sp. M361]
MLLLHSKSFWFRQLRDIFLLGLIGVPFSFLMCPECWDDSLMVWYSILVCATFWIVLAKGNVFVNYITNEYVDWLKEPVKRLLVSLLGHSGFTVIAVIIMGWLFKYFFDIRVGSPSATVSTSLIISLLATLIMNSRRFLLSWRNLALESERMKREAISAKYESLKNQVNPHFLFNSLNALTNLVYEDADLSAKFIKKLSQVYRYVLETREKELVSLKEELEFVRSYVFLQKIRHEDALIFEMDEQIDQNYYVVPLAVQMLVENAFKHNVVSDNEPLTIKILQENEFLVIQNTLQKKNILKEESSGVGLVNIKARYEFLSEKQIQVSDTKGLFMVKLPLLNES